MNWNIALLGTFHPAVETFRRLAEEGWICVLIVPESAGYKNDELLRLADEYEVPWSYELSDVEKYEVNLLLAANYPKIVPAAYLERYPCINTHWSELPKYRGVHPTAWALLNEDYEVGVTAHWMEEDFDEGDILGQAFVDVTSEMNIQDLHDRLTDVQADLVLRILRNREERGRWESRPQNHEQATYVPKRVPEDGIIHWTWPTERIWNLVRALPAPKYPGAFTYLDGRKLVVWEAKPAQTPSYFSTPGQVVRVLRDEGVWVKTGDTCIQVETVELEGRDEPEPADQVLRRGDKLGFDSQRELAALRSQVTKLQDEIERLKEENGAT